MNHVLQYQAAEINVQTEAERYASRELSTLGVNRRKEIKKDAGARWRVNRREKSLSHDWRLNRR